MGLSCPALVDTVVLTLNLSLRDLRTLQPPETVGRDLLIGKILKA
jgi:hypothetical protein